MPPATLPPDELAKAMDVIRRETDLCKDDPSPRCSMRLLEVACTRSPFCFTISGHSDFFNQPSGRA